MTFRWKGLRARSRAPETHTTRPRLEQLETRIVPYALSGNAWPNPQLVSLSFEPDGTIISTNMQGLVGSNLFSSFNARFGSPSVWQNQVARAAQTWAQATNLNFNIVSDDGVGMGLGPDQQGDPNHGDIRVGGYDFNNTNLAIAYMPPPVTNYDIAGDFKFDTAYAFHIGTTYDLYSVALHEIGHTLGLYHSSTRAVMYGAYQGVLPGLFADDVSGIQAIYGGARRPDAYDAAASNGTFATATDVTSTIDPNSLTAVVPNLDVTTTSDADFYQLTAPALTQPSFNVTVQSSGLSLLMPKVTVYAADQVTVLGTASGAGQYDGSTLSLTVSGVQPGQTFYVKVSGVDTTAFSTGAYALTLNFGTGPNPTVPLPNTTIPNGNPIQGGGGSAESAGSDEFPALDPSTPVTVVTPATPAASALPTLPPWALSPAHPALVGPSASVAAALAAAPGGTTLGAPAAPLVSSAFALPASGGGDQVRTTDADLNTPAEQTAPSPPPATPGAAAPTERSDRPTAPAQAAPAARREAAPADANGASATPAPALLPSAVAEPTSLLLPEDGAALGWEAEESLHVAAVAVLLGTSAVVLPHRRDDRRGAAE